MDRRSFFKSIGRNALLAALAALGVAGWRHGKINRQATGACSADACRTCGRSASCGRQEKAALRTVPEPQQR